MSVVSFKELANQKRARRGKSTKITGTKDAEIDLIALSIHPHDEGDGFGVLGHLVDDETCKGFVNVFDDQLLIDDGSEHGVSTRALMEIHIRDSLVVTGRMSGTPGQLRLVKGLKFIKE